MFTQIDLNVKLAGEHRKIVSLTMKLSGCSCCNVKLSRKHRLSANLLRKPYLSMKLSIKLELRMTLTQKLYLIMNLTRKPYIIAHSTEIYHPAKKYLALILSKKNSWTGTKPKVCPLEYQMVCA